LKLVPSLQNSLNLQKNTDFVQKKKKFASLRNFLKLTLPLSILNRGKMCANMLIGVCYNFAHYYRRLSLESVLILMVIQYYYRAGFSLDKAKNMIFTEYKLCLDGMLKNCNCHNLIMMRIVQPKAEIVKKYINYLSDSNINLIILPEDNLFYEHTELIYAGHELGIKTLILPYTIVNQREWLLSFSKIKSFQAHYGANLFYRLIFKNCIRMFAGRKLLLPVSHLLFRKSIDPREYDDWLIGNGIADVLLVESDHMMRYYQKSGLTAVTMKLIGGLNDDYIFDRWNNRANLRKSLNIGDHELVLVVCLPPDNFENRRDEIIEFNSFKEFLRTFYDSLKEFSRSNGIHVIYGPHPAIKVSDIEYFRALGACVSDLNINELIAISDCYFAMASATIRAAMLLDLPIVNYDLYNYKYTDYDGCESVAYCNSLADALNAISFAKSNTRTIAVDGNFKSKFVQLLRSL
jgi:hypothetical protein